jgi:hypothetical protein
MRPVSSATPRGHPSRCSKNSWARTRSVPIPPRTAAGRPLLYRSATAGSAMRSSSRDVPCGSLVSLLPARGDRAASWPGTVQLPACDESDCSGRQAPPRAETRFQIHGAETPEGCVPGRALALYFVRVARDIPALYDFLQESVAQEALPVRARQVARANGPGSFPGLEVPQDFEGLREFFRRFGHGRFSSGFVFLLSDCVALYLYYCAVRLLSYYVVHFYLIVSREDWSRPPGSEAPHPIADKLISLLLRQVDLASASESLCRGLGSRWFTEWFHRNALVAHFQHGQVFCTARQLKDYAVTRCRLHQRAPQR